jgi:3-deoxy-D-manno-octulosonic acid kinase
LCINPCKAFAGQKRILFDASLFDEPPIHLFDPRSLEANNLLTGRGNGRGQVHFFRYQGLDLVLRSFRRGGLVQKILSDRYIRRKVENSRSWREWELLARMYNDGLPVPRPVAAHVELGTLFYSADLITKRIPGARSLAEILQQGPLSPETWRNIGATIAWFHNRGIWHSDLNAENILLDESSGIYLLDFDRGKMGATQLRQRRNLARLLRSLRKIRRAKPFFAFEEAFWQSLLHGYHIGRKTESAYRERSTPSNTE